MRQRRHRDGVANFKEGTLLEALLAVVRLNKPNHELRDSG
jgi:hypothetical protein